MSATPRLTLEVHGDVIEILPKDAFDRELAEQVVAAVDEARTRHSRVFLLAASGGNITPDARKFISEWLRATPVPLETAVWGGGVVQRAIAEMIARSVHFFRPGAVHISFHATREEALTWIAAQRGRPPPF